MFVGREAELARVMGDVTGALEGQGPRVVALTGPAGIGKSRLLAEAVRRLDERVPVWRAEGDAFGDARPLHVAAELVRSGFGRSRGDSVVRVLLRRQARRAFGSRDARRLTAFIGELLGLSPTGEEPIEIRAARQDPMLMADQIRGAFLDLVEHVSKERGLCLIVDDLSRVDRASLELIHRAFEEIPDGRLVLLTAARTEGKAGEFRPDWPHLVEIELGPLSQTESRRILTDLLGESDADRLVDRLLERALGNPFFLRELGRASKNHAELPALDTVLSVVSTRLERLSADARRLLRAASFYGTLFSLSALSPLTRTSPGLAGSLDELQNEGLIHPRARSYVDGEPAFAFAHDLVREAAARLLTREDLEHGHRAAGRYLAALADADPHAVAEHFFRGRDLERGAEWMTRAAERALGKGALADSERLAERAVSFGAEGATLGRARLVLAQVKRWQGVAADAHASARSAVELLPAGSLELGRAFGELATACGRLRFIDELEEHAARMLDLLEHEPSGPLVAAASRAIVQLYYNGRADAARDGLVRLERVSPELLAAEPLARARLLGAKSVRALFAGDPVGQLQQVSAAREAFLEAGDLREACLYELTIGHAFIELGCFADAARTLREARRTARRLGARLLENLATLNLGLALARSGEEALAREAVDLERAAVAAVESGGDARVRCAARCYLAEALMASRDYVHAELEARQAVELATNASTMAALAQALLADALRHLGRADDAASVLSERPAAVDSEESEEGALRWLLSAAETELDRGERRRATETVAQAHEKLLSRASAIVDPTYRESFLGRVREHVRIRELHQKLR